MREFGQLFTREDLTMGDGLPRNLNEPPTPPAPDVAPPTGKVTCEFCSCTLGPSGEYLQLSPRAKELRALEDTLDTVRGELAAAREDVAAALRERDEARAALATKNGEDEGANSRGQKLSVKW